MNAGPWLLGAAALLLPACYGPPGAPYHTPHAYKGKTDPLLSLEKTPEQQAVLGARFRLVQVDR